MTVREVMEQWHELCNKVFEMADVAEEALNDEKYDMDLQLMVKQANRLIAVIED